MYVLQQLGVYNVLFIEIIPIKGYTTLKTQKGWKGAIPGVTRISARSVGGGSQYYD